MVLLIDGHVVQYRVGQSAHEGQGRQPVSGQHSVQKEAWHSDSDADRAGLAASRCN